MAARQMVRDELKDVKFFDKKQSPEKANDEVFSFKIQEAHLSIHRQSPIIPLVTKNIL